MGDSAVVVQLAGDAMPRLPAAISTLVPKDENRFIAALELGYLTASADGLDAKERDSIAHTLEKVTGIGFDHDSFEAHFADLDDAVAALGRRERLARTAAEFETDDERADAIRFAALVAMSDGTLHEPELVVLVEAGSHFHWDSTRIRGLVEDAAARVAGGAR
jgi:tellurite resistance protein